MNLATRCTACGTIFRVVQDQLRVSEGWVRCGRCAEVFDAGEQLFDLERDSPPPWPPQGAPEPAAPQVSAPAPRAAAPQPPYHPYQGQFQPSQPGRLGPPTPTPAPYHPPAPAYAPPAPRREAEPWQAPAPQPAPPAYAPSHFQPEPPPADPRDSGWMASDSELNPFAPPRRMPEVEEPDAYPPMTASREPARDFGHDHGGDPGGDHRHDRDFEPERARASRFESESQFDTADDRREPFIEPPAVDPRAHLPEPKGLRFEEDELPPPMPLDDDERPDVLLALSPATAAQLDAREPSLDDSPIAAPADDTSVEDEKAKKKRLKKEEAERAQAEKALKAAAAAQAKAEKAEARAAAKAASGPTTTAPDGSVPSFLRQAEAAARWQRPGVRIALGASAAVLTLGLIGQGLWQGREAIAAQYPGARPALAAAAQAMGQELKPWRHIEALSVESSSLNPAGAGNHYRLTLSLRNRSNWEVAQPWVDLSLSDASGQMVIRRMLSPAELQAGKAAMAAGTDQQLQLVFDSGAQKISGYTVELFYPS